MKAIGRNLIIEKEKQVTTETKGGLILAELHREDIRYTKAKIISIGDEVEGLKESDTIFFDRHAGHSIRWKEKLYHVIQMQDVVLVE